MDAAQDIAADWQGNGPDANGQGDCARFEIAPLASETIPRTAVVHLELVDIDHVGRVDRVGPAEVAVVAEEGEGRSGEVRARIVPAFLAFDDQLVPCHPATQRLVAVRNKRRWPAGFLRRNREGVRPVMRAVGTEGRIGDVFLCLRLAYQRVGRRLARVTGNVGSILEAQRLTRDQRLDHSVEAEEERLAQGKSCGHIAPVDREEIAELHLARVLLREIVEACGIGFEQSARILRQLRIMAVRRAARVEQVVDIVDRRTILARNGAVAALGHGDHVLQRGEIIFSMGDSDTVSDIAVALAVDMRHAIFVANDLGGIAVGAARYTVAFRPEGFPARQRHESHKNECQ